MPENSGKKEGGGNKGILDAPPKTTFVMGILVGVVVCAIVGVVLSLTVVQTKTASNTNTVAGANSNSNTNADAVDPRVSATSIAQYASDLGLDITKFNSCINDGEKTKTVTDMATAGQALGVQGTPATFVNGYLVSGAIPYADFKAIVDEVLAGNAPTSQYAEKTAVDVKVTEADHVEGDAGVKVTLVEYSDFQCPYCLNHASTLKQILEEYSGKVKIIFRHFPLSFHANAQLAAEASECASVQGKFWEMHDKLFEL
ncbi:MAG: thioredoxin domain-containing protein [Patescibacteria group bacterium]